MKRLILVSLMTMLVLGLTFGAAASTPGTLLIWADETRAGVLEAVVQQFSDEYGIPVEIQELGFGDIRDNLEVTGPAGTGPDIIVGAHDWLGQLVVNGLIEPIDLGDREADFLDVTLQAFSWGGDLYGVPYAVESIGLIYNRDLVPTPPTTFEELIEIAKPLTNRSERKYGFALPMPDPYHTFPLFSSEGGYVFGLDDAGVLDPHDVGLNNAGAVQGLELFRRMLHDEQIMPVGVDYNGMAPLFHSGDLAMMITGPWAFADIRAADIDFGFAPVPALGDNPGRPFVGVHAFMISAFSENKLLAEIFLNDFIATEAVMQDLFDNDPRPTAYIPVGERTTDVVTAGVMEAASHGVPMPNIPEMASVWAAWADAIDLVVNQEQSPQEALDDAVSRIRSAIESGQ